MSHLRDPTRLSNSIPRPAQSSSLRTPSPSAGPPRPRSGSSSSSSRRRLSSVSKENEPISTMSGSTYPLEQDVSDVRKRNTSSRPKSSPSSPAHSKTASTSGSSYYNGRPTLASISDDQDPDIAVTDSPMSEKDFRPPPPAPSSAMGTEGRPLTRPRRSSSIKRKLSPGVRPAKAVDWEIPRKTLHSSIGFLALFLYFLEPPSVKPLVIILSASLVTVTIADYLRFNFPAFRELWEANLGFLMRESERDKVNGVVYYLVGVITVLTLYPREVAVVSVLTLSWSDTTASTIGRLWGRYTPPLPAHLPLVPAIRFAPRKSLAGFLAATITGAAICTGFWWNGSADQWAVLSGRIGVIVTAGVVGVGGAIAEALDLGLDDNLTLPIISGAIIWAWLSVTQVFLG
ncbi:uncharacterized protein MKK02DRAFT_28450 [Dioszegia hungarica]|uniref:Phosphatidate cytidylyltransferase n=1 Tax=Dioszegia hungarica TaxID=4972 RepID=A0AA38LTT3_9TREE|nr:uncharacterized protein MKK02DRAFT_28450 [Dioszegia hungarica]KAI9633659.1 hypothetical protein MKK02DRAFT_28450 [Dioszegia hungarica]